MARETFPKSRSTTADLLARIDDLEHELAVLRRRQAGTRIATLFLDNEYVIQDFTPEVIELYALRSTDVGRNVKEVPSRAIDMPVYPPLTPGPDVIQHDVAMPDGRVFQRRIRPYPDGIVVTFVDVTDVRHGDQRFRRLADAVPVITWMAAPDGEVQYFNSRWREYTGQLGEDALGWSWSQVLHPEDAARTDEVWRESLATGRDYEIEYRLRRIDGTYRWHRGSGVAFRDEASRITGWFGTCVDIHEQRTIIEAIPQYVWRTTPDGAADYASTRFQHFTGRSEAELLGWGWLGLIDPQDRPAVEVEWAARREAGEAVVVEFRMIPDASGAVRWIRSNGAPYFDSEGRLHRYYGTWTDVTEQRRASEAIRSSEAHFRSLVDNSPATMWITDASSSCTYLSTKWYEITGRTPAQDLGTGWIENVHPDDRAAAMDAFFTAVEARGRITVQYRLHHRDNSYRWVLDSGLPLLSADGKFEGYIGTVIDIDDQILLRERFNRSAAATDLGIWYCDLPFGSLIWNTEVRRHFFMAPEPEVTIDDFYAHIHPDDRAEVRNAIEHSIQNHAAYDVQIRTFDGQDLSRLKRIRAIGWTDYDGNRPIRFDGITLDISAEYRRESELTQAKHDAERARRVAEDASESKTRFLANMSHEIRTPLSAIVGYSELLRALVAGRSDPAADEVAYVDRITRNSAHLSRLIDELLDLSKIEADKIEIEHVPVDVERVVEDVLSTMQLKADAKGLTLSVRWEVARPLRLVTDPVRLAQVLTNIIGNSVKFTERGRVDVVVDRAPGRLRFRITDTGIGLAVDQRTRVFEPFSQADPSVSRKYGGTGLGLSLSRQLARLLGGDLHLESSEEGHGSVFVIEITAEPDLTTPPTPAPRAAPSAKPLADRRILVVDDSPDNRTIIGLFLSAAGARIDEAANGQEGVETALGQDFDLVLMDIQMPTMDGYQALARLRTLNYRRPVVALTAHAFKEERDRCLSAGFDHYLTKPIDRAVLIETLRKILALE